MKLLDQFFQVRSLWWLWCIVIGLIFFIYFWKVCIESQVYGVVQNYGTYTHAHACTLINCDISHVTLTWKSVMWDILPGLGKKLYAHRFLKLLESNRHTKYKYIGWFTCLPYKLIISIYTRNYGTKTIPREICKSMLSKLRQIPTL